VVLSLKNRCIVWVIVVVIIVHDNLLQELIAVCCFDIDHGLLRHFMPSWSEVLHEWQSALDRGDSVRTLFVDVSKAFDRVNHTILLHTLRTRGIPGFLLKWFHSFLAARRQRIRVEGKRSGWLDLMGSMPRGSLLGLLMSLLDDLSANCSIHKFVDDTTLTVILRRSQSLMQQYLDELTEWTHENVMVINSGKLKK